MQKKIFDTKLVIYVTKPEKNIESSKETQLQKVRTVALLLIRQ